MMDSEQKNSHLTINKDLSQLDDNQSSPRANHDSQLCEGQNGSTMGGAMPPKWSPNPSLMQQQTGNDPDAEANAALARVDDAYVDESFLPHADANALIYNQEDKILTQESSAEDGSPMHFQKLNSTELPRYMKVQVQMQPVSKQGRVRGTKNKVDEYQQDVVIDSETQRIETKMHSQPSSHCQYTNKSQSKNKTTRNRQSNTMTTVTRSSPQLAMLEKMQQQEVEGVKAGEQLQSDNQLQLAPLGAPGTNFEFTIPQHFSQRMVSPLNAQQQTSLAPLSGFAQTKRSTKQQQQEWRKLQISPMAKNTRNLQQPHSYQPIEKACLGERLFQECQQLSKDVANEGFKKDSRPNVRFFNRDDIEHHIQKKGYLNSTDTLYEQPSSQQDYQLTKIDENGSLYESSIQYHDSIERSMHESSIQTRFSPISSPQSSQLRMFESVERLKAFQSTAFNKHSIQPYVKSDCKYIMTSTRETMQANLKRSYGFQPSISDNIVTTTKQSGGGAQTHRALQGGNTSKFDSAITNFRLKKVPLQSRDGHFVSNVASPDESIYAKRKLLSKQRKELAMHVQSEIRSKQLEMGYNIASPAARMRSLLLTEQKKRNSLGKPSGNNSAVLYENISGLKTWRTRI